MERFRWIVNEHPTLRKWLLPLILIRRFFIKRRLAHVEQIYQNLCGLLEEYPIIKLEEFKGIFQVNPKSDIFKGILLSGHYESKYVKLCLEYLDASRDAIDVGANIGFYSVLFAKVIESERRVLAIEPISSMVSLLRRNIMLNNLEKKILVFEGAVLNKEGTLSMKVHPNKEEYSTFGSWTHPSISQEKYVVETVKVSTLDKLVELYSLNPGFIKIDVEGMEHFVLYGAEKTLSFYRPVVIMELSDPLLRANGSSSREIVNIIKSYKYRVIDANFMDENYENRKYTEILCIPKERG